MKSMTFGCMYIFIITLKLAGINIHNVVISTALCVAKRSFKDVNPPMTSSSVMSVQCNHIRSDYIELCSAGEINSCYLT